MEFRPHRDRWSNADIFFVLLSPSQARLGSQTSWATMPREPEKVGLVGHRGFRGGFSVSVFMCLSTRHMEMESDLWRANTLLLGVTPRSLCSSHERLLSIGRVLGR